MDDNPLFWLISEVIEQLGLDADNDDVRESHLPAANRLACGTVSCGLAY